MVKLQAISWEAYDNDNNEYVVHIFGRTAEGKSVCVTTSFKPYFFIKLKGDKVDYKIEVNEIKERLEKRFSSDTEQYSQIVHSLSGSECKDLMGFSNSVQCKFVKITCNTLGNMKKCENVCHRFFSGRVYEANIEPFLRLMHRTEIKSTGWFEADGDATRFSHCDIDIFVPDWKTMKPIDRDDIAPLKIMSFDIETYSSTGKFPSPLEPGDAVFQIGMTTRLYGSDEIVDKVCLCYKKTSGPDVICYDSEKELLEGFRAKLVEFDPDVLTGYNIFGFDLEYVYHRAVYNKCKFDFFMLGKLRDRECKYVAKRLSSGALGDNLLKMVPMNGRYIFDLFHEIKREKKLDSYSLNNVSKLYLDDTKIDMSAKEMFARYVREDPDELGEVAEYCLKDTILPHKLIDKLCIFTNLIEMAKATWVPLSYLSERAQQIKVYSQITRKARELGFLVPTIKHNTGNNTEGYEGATVLEAHIGAYYEPITALDFASLYPSIMMAHNLCFSTLVLSPKFANVPGIEYETFTINKPDPKDPEKKIEVTYKFAQNVPSLLPEILKELKEFRKKAKKLMALHKGTQLEEIYNGQQLAYKISMNSIYGFCGAKHGILPCVPIAATTTSQGRNMIAMTKECVEKNFPGAVVRYGDTDSVMIQFDSGGMDTQEAIEKSWELGKKAAEMCNNLFKKPNDLELEKVYCPFILYSKKRYAAKMWVQNRAGEMEMEKVDVKGLQLVRRDNTPYTRDVCKEVLNMILESNDPQPAIDRALERAQELIDGQVDIKRLIMSKSLSDEYKTKNGKWKYTHMVEGKEQEIPSQPHVRVVEKINTREPGSHPQSGDRVPFVLIKTDDPRAKMFEKAEDPKHVTTNTDIELDYMYYFTNQLKKPIEDLLDPLIQGADIFHDLMPPKPPRKKRAVPKCKSVSEMFKDYALNNSK